MEPRKLPISTIFLPSVSGGVQSTRFASRRLSNAKLPVQPMKRRRRLALRKRKWSVRTLREHRGKAAKRSAACCS